MTRSDMFVAVIRTAVPTAIGSLLAWLISQIPAVGDVLETVDGILLDVFPDGAVTAAAVLTSLAVAGVVALYYWLARLVGQRFPAVERFLLGSAKTPTYTPPPVPVDPDELTD
ncbi:hypothetical protein [Agromyces sp. SYSU T00194]|uniref:hypothetical protein n=1 Tax=Agromyces chitinivorans TaxID=3158560 RepID=UPI00339AAD19